MTPTRIFTALVALAVLSATAGALLAPIRGPE